MRIFGNKTVLINLRIALLIIISLLSITLILFVTIVCRYSVIRGIDEYVSKRLEVASYPVHAAIKEGYARGEAQSIIINNAKKAAYISGLYVKFIDNENNAIINTFTNEAYSNIMNSSYKTSVYVKGDKIGTLFVAAQNNDGLLHPTTGKLLELTVPSFYIPVIAGAIISLIYILIIIKIISAPLSQLHKQAASIKYLRKNTISINSIISEYDELCSNLNFFIEMFKEEERWRQNLMDDLAHELRTPLSIISMQLEAISDGVVGYSEERMKNIAQEVERLKRLVIGIHELSTAEGAKFELNYNSHDVCLLVKKVVSYFLPLCKERHITINQKYLYEPCLILCDNDKIIQSIINILSNAVKYSRDYSVIEISVVKSEQDVRIAIRDHGVGIPEDCIPHLFKRFYRVDSSRSVKTGGSGLGLCIAKSIIEAHKGEIQVETKYQVGSTFTIILPRSISLSEAVGY